MSLYLWKRPHWKALVSSLVLAKCLTCRLWEDSEYATRQLPGIGPTLASQLVGAGKTSFQTITEANPRDLERILNRHPPLGNQLQEAVWRIPQFILSLNLIDERIEVIVEMTNTGHNPQHSLSLVVGDSNNQVLLRQRLPDSSWSLKKCQTFNIPVKICNNATEVQAFIISDCWVGIDKKTSLKLKTNSTRPNVTEFDIKPNKPKVLITKTKPNQMPTPSRVFNPILNLSQFAHKQAKKIVPHIWEMNEKSESLVSSTQDENDIDLQSKNGLSLPSEENNTPLMISGVSEDSADFDFIEQVQSSQDVPSFCKPNQSMFPSFSSNVEQLSFSKRQNNNLIFTNKYKTSNTNNISLLNQRFSCYNPNELYPQTQEATTNLKRTEPNDIHSRSKSQIDFSSMSIQRNSDMRTKNISANCQVVETSRNKHWKNVNEPVAEIQELCRNKPMNFLRQNKTYQQNYDQDMYQLSLTQVPYRSIQSSTESLKNNRIVLDEKFEMKKSQSLLMNQIETGDNLNTRNHVGKHNFNHSCSQTNHIVDSYQIVSPSNQHQDPYSQTDYESNNYGSLTAKLQCNPNSFSGGTFTNSSNYHSNEGHIDNPTNSGFRNVEKPCIERVPSVNTCAGIEHNVRLFNCETMNKNGNIDVENQYKNLCEKFNKNESNYGGYSHYKDSVFDSISDEGQEKFSPSGLHTSRNGSFTSNFECDNLSCSVDNNTLRDFSTCSSLPSFCYNQKQLGFNTVPIINKRALSKTDAYEYANSTVNSELAPLPSIIRNKNALCATQTSKRVILDKQNCPNLKSKLDYCVSQNPSNAMNRSVKLKNNKENSFLHERDPFVLERKQQFELSITSVSPTTVGGTNNHTMAPLAKNSNYLNTLLKVPESNISNVFKERDKKVLVNQCSLNKISESKTSEINKQVFLEEKNPNSCIANFNKSMIESKTGILMRQDSVGYEVHIPSEATKLETIDLSNYDTENEDFILDDTGMCCLTETDEELLLADEVDSKTSFIDSHLTAGDVNENSAQNTNNKSEVSAFSPILSDELIFDGQFKKTISVKPLFLDFEEINSKHINVNTQNCFADVPYYKDGSKSLQPVHGEFQSGSNKNCGKVSRLDSSKNEKYNSLVKVTEDLQYGKNIVIKTHTESETINFKSLPKCYKIDSNHQKLNTQEVSSEILKPLVINQTGTMSQSTYSDNSTLIDNNTHQHLGYMNKKLNLSQKPLEEKEIHFCDSKAFVGSDQLKLTESKEKLKVEIEESLKNISKGNLTCATNTEVKGSNKSNNFTSSVETDIRSIPNSADVDFEANSENEKEKPDFRDSGLIFSIKRDSSQTNFTGNSKQSRVSHENNKKMKIIENKLRNAEMSVTASHSDQFKSLSPSQCFMSRSNKCKGDDWETNLVKTVVLGNIRLSSNPPKVFKKQSSTSPCLEQESNNIASEYQYTMLPSRDCSPQSIIESSPAKYLKLDLSKSEKNIHRYGSSKLPSGTLIKPCMVQGEEKTSPNKSLECLQNNNEKHENSVTESKRTNKLCSNSSFNYYINNEHLDANSSSIYSVKERKFKCDKENYSHEFPLDQQMKFKSRFHKEKPNGFVKDEINPNSGFSNYDYSKGSSSQDLFATQKLFTHSLHLSPGNTPSSGSLFMPNLSNLSSLDYIKLTMSSESSSSSKGKSPLLGYSPRYI